ncbi:MAG: hypothetical protein V4584_13020 [Verrucomicrobiota bacterium]
MSLPQRKKSAEEIAKLRESLGIGGPPPVEEPSPAEIPLPETVAAPAKPEPPAAEEPPPPAKQEEIVPSPPLAPLPVEEKAVEEVPELKPVRSLKRSERIPVLPVEESGPPPSEHHPVPAPAPPAPPPPAPASHGPKMVRSLRKSEQGPLPVVPPPPADSKLPVHRRSDQEINELRRREALAQTGLPPHPQTLTAHRALIIPGYLAVIAAAICIYFYDLDKTIPAACVLTSLLIAAFIFVRKPFSRHHAAFIAAIALFVIVFGALHYFPNIQHGT